MITPYPLGLLPRNIRHWQNDRPDGRILLDAEYTVGTTVTVVDGFTGESFKITPAACGAGCRCAAEAEWLPSV